MRAEQRPDDPEGSRRPERDAGARERGDAGRDRQKGQKGEEPGQGDGDQRQSGAVIGFVEPPKPCLGAAGIEHEELRQEIDRDADREPGARDGPPEVPESAFVGRLEGDAAGTQRARRVT